MSDPQVPFAFSHLVPGFEFLKTLGAATGTAGDGAATGGMPGLAGVPGLSSWVAPTLSVEEVDRRIQELKTVQYWLEQNGHALKATIQALEVQRMTLSTLRGMNLRMEDLANAFTRQAREVGAAMQPAPAPDQGTPAEAAGDEAATAGHGGQAEGAASGESAAASLIDPMKWWGALTHQFQEIANSALSEAAQLRMPDLASPMADAMRAMGSLAPGAGSDASGEPAPTRPVAAAADPEPAPKAERRAPTGSKTPRARPSGTSAKTRAASTRASSQPDPRPGESRRAAPAPSRGAAAAPERVRRAQGSATDRTRAADTSRASTPSGRKARTR